MGGRSTRDLQRATLSSKGDKKGNDRASILVLRFELWRDDELLEYTLLIMNLDFHAVVHG